jgi:hypothetical protein
VVTRLSTRRPADIAALADIPFAEAPLSCARTRTLSQTVERPFEKIYVRCSDADLGGDRVYVGHFGSRGFRLNNNWGDCRYGLIGLSSARRIDFWWEP